VNLRSSCFDNASPARYGQEMESRRRRWGSRLLRAAVVIAIVACAVFALGVSGPEDAAIREFDEAATLWQNDPEFRLVAFEYCVRGSRAVRTRPLWVPAGAGVMAIRSIPGLPRQFAVNPTSQLHYDHFRQGPLCAYLHLCSEQSVADYANVLETVGKSAGPVTRPATLPATQASTRPAAPATTQSADAGPRAFLDAFKMDFPVCTDAGALQSVTALFRDVEASRALTVRENVGPRLMPHIAALARELNLPQDPVAMTAAQQQAVLDLLDARVRREDPELWRTKQLSDFCGGVWAQVFAPPYRKVTQPLIVLHAVAWPGLVALGAWLGFRWGRRRSKRIGEPEVEQTVEPLPAPAQIPTPAQQM
jgi:hypothetical protein